MVLVFVNPFLEVVGYPYVKGSRFTPHDIDIICFHGAILAITRWFIKEEHIF